MFHLWNLKNKKPDDQMINDLDEKMDEEVSEIRYVV